MNIFYTLEKKSIENIIYSIGIYLIYQKNSSNYEYQNEIRAFRSI